MLEANRVACLLDFLRSCSLRSFWTLWSGFRGRIIFALHSSNKMEEVALYKMRM